MTPDSRFLTRGTRFLMNWCWRSWLSSESSKQVKTGRAKCPARFFTYPVKIYVKSTKRLSLKPSYLIFHGQIPTNSVVINTGLGW